MKIIKLTAILLGLFSVHTLYADTLSAKTTCVELRDSSKGTHVLALKPINAEDVTPQLYKIHVEDITNQPDKIEAICEYPILIPDGGTSVEAAAELSKNDERYGIQHSELRD